MFWDSDGLRETPAYVPMPYVPEAERRRYADEAEARRAAEEARLAELARQRAAEEARPRLAAGEYTVAGARLIVPADGGWVRDTYGNELFPVPATVEELAGMWQEFLNQGE